MPNVTALEQIHNFIEARQLKTMRQWSSRKIYEVDGVTLEKYAKSMVKKIKRLFAVVSGNDVVSMLKDVLTVKEIESLTMPKYTEAIKNLSVLYSNTDFKKRHSIIRPFKNASFKYSEIRRFGFKVSRRLWQSCHNMADRNSGGGQSISSRLQQAIRSYLNDNSAVASNRLIKSKNRKDLNFNKFIPARYLEDSKTELFKKSPFYNIISKSTFFKYTNINGEFKNPFRFTDLCEYCEKEIVLKKRISQVFKDENYEIQDKYEIDKIRNDFKIKIVTLQNEDNRSEELNNRILKLNDLINDLRDHEALIFHRNIAHCQRISYNSQRSDVSLLKGKILIEMDYKQRICIGLSPRQINKEYYEQQTRSCLGFGIYYVDVNDNIREINFDIISYKDPQKAFSVIKGLRLLRQQEFFIAIQQNDYIVWADTGTHFRCNEIMAFFFRELAEENIQVNFNFFGEKHGKNGRDAHFSNVSRFVKAESLVRKISSSQDVADAIMNRQRMANENNTDIDSRTTTYAVVLDYDNDQINPDANKTFSIKNLESFYNYRNLRTKLEEVVSSVLSNIEYLNYVPVKIGREKTLNSEYEIEKEVPCVPANVNYSTIHNKKIRIKAALSRLASINTANADRNIEILNFFKPNQGVAEIDSEIEEEAAFIPRVKPQFCKGEGERTLKKKPCVECNELCAYDIVDLLSGDHCKVGQRDLQEELAIHKHPQTRLLAIVNGKNVWRGSADATRELIDHYKYAHNMTE